MPIDTAKKTIHHVAGTGQQGYSGDGGPARAAALAGPKGLAWFRGRLFVADTENHAVREIDLARGAIRTVVGTGQRGDGPDGDPLRCALARPHGVLVDARGTLRFDLFRHTPRGYASTRTQQGWVRSEVFGRSFRLLAPPASGGQPDYTLEVR